MSFSCYILECMSGKFYCGSTFTSRIQTRFLEHRLGKGSKWCQQFRPCKILKTVDNLTSWEAIRQESVECLRVMREKKDIQCCRGGDYLFPLGSDWWGRHILAAV
jgi:predicted GIY-YIG superfamily endonuclease